MAATDVADLMGKARFELLLVHDAEGRPGDDEAAATDAGHRDDDILVLDDRATAGAPADRLTRQVPSQSQPGAADTDEHPKQGRGQRQSREQGRSVSERMSRDTEVRCQERQDLVQAPARHGLEEAGLRQVDEDEDRRADRDQGADDERQEPDNGGGRGGDAMKRKNVRQDDSSDQKTCDPGLEQGDQPLPRSRLTRLA